MRAVLFLETTAVRETENGKPIASSRRELESNLPKGGTIEPVSVEVTENNTVVEEPLEVFKILVELSGIDKTREEVLKEMNISKWTDEEGNERRFLDGCIMDEQRMPLSFLNKYYEGQWAFIKSGDKEIYGQVRVDNIPFKMKTSKGILVMPCVSVCSTGTTNGRTGGVAHYLFFPMKALLAPQEEGLVSVYETNLSTEGDRSAVEREIMQLLARLPMCCAKKSVFETNKIWGKIEEICREEGVRRAWIGNGKLELFFDRRVAIDTSGVEDDVVLPPFTIKIDLRNFNVTGNAHKHPHCLSDGSLCLGDELTQLAQDCIRDKDLTTLVRGLIKFAYHRTSEDARNSDREPACCIREWADDNSWYQDDGNNLPVTKEQIIDTLKMRYPGNSPTHNLEFNRFLYGN